MAQHPDNASSKSYGLVQSTLLVAFASAVLWDRTPPLFMMTAVSTAVARAVCLLGLLMIAAAVFELRRVIQIAPAPKEGGSLVTSGIYRWFRHPIYTAMLLEVFGLFLLNPRVFVGLAAVACAVFLFLKVRFEERLLSERYEGYTDYRARTFGLVPLRRG
jgi:protein-S-isoprenylcysteine O-methyltransferase Ste14